MLGTCLTLPVIGLYFSLRRMNFLAAWLATVGVGILLPWVADRFVILLLHEEWIFSDSIRLFAFQLVIGGLVWLLLYWNLKRRRFVLTA